MRPILRALPAAAVLTALAAPGAAAQVQVSIRPLAPVEAIYLADLLPGSASLRPDLLGITLLNPERQSLSAVLELAVAREDPSPEEIFRGTTDPFAIQEPVRHLTSRDLASRGSDVYITQYEVNDHAVEGAIESGRLPPGTYLFTATLRSASGGAVLDSDELRLTVAYPSRVELLAPGAPADGPPPVVPGPTPRFLWSADGETPGARYRLRVVQVDGAGQAVEALQSGYPAWETTVAGTSAVYPASVQALRLEPGGTYAWQVTREVSTSGGVEVIESPIYWFRVGGGGGGRTAGGTLDLRFAALLRALGLAGELDGFTPVGATLEDGRVLPLQTLEELLAAIAAGEVAVLSVRVR